MNCALDHNLGKNLAARKMNMLGEVDGLACIVNDPKRLRKVKQASMLSSTIASIKVDRQVEKKVRNAAREVKEIMNAAKTAAVLPVVDLLNSEGISVSATNLTIAEMLQFMDRIGIADHVPKGLKSKSKVNLISFLSAIQRLKDVDENNADWQLIEAAARDSISAISAPRAIWSSAARAICSSVASASESRRW